MNTPRRNCITLLGSAVSVVLCVGAAAQEDTTGWAMINGTRASTRNSKEMMAKVPAAI
jgi:hypothetical protein